MPTDAELLESWRAGDVRAGNTLLERHVDALIRFFDTKASEAVDDLVQRTLLACVVHRDRVRDAASFRGFLFAVARNELFDHYKGQARQAGFDPATSAVTDMAPSPSAALAADDTRGAIMAALQQIPVELQIALELHYWEDLSTAELGDALGIPQGTVKSRLRRAKELLRARMDASATPNRGESGDAERELDAWAAAVGLRARQ